MSTKRSYDYQRLDRLEKLLSGLEQHADAVRAKVGRTYTRDLRAAIKHLRALEERVDRAESHYRQALAARDDYDRDSVHSLEKEIRKAIRFALDQDDPRRADFE